MFARITQLDHGFEPSNLILSVPSATLRHPPTPAPDPFPVSFPQFLLHSGASLSPSACDIYFSRLFSLTPQTPAVIGSCFFQGHRGQYRCSVLAGSPLLVVPYLFQIRSRVDVIRHVVKNGLLWDDLYIGFQTRLQRDPDVYHHL